MEKSVNKTRDESSDDGKVIISCPIVKNKFVKKNGEITDRDEYYLERSIQNYFIKFCESKVSQEEIDAYLEQHKDDFIQTIKVEVAFRTGAWDQCEGKEVESRMGEYVVLYRIL